MNGLFIPNEIAKLNTLNWPEKVLLSIYWYRCNGRLKCCKMRNEDIYNELMVSKNTFHRMKTHLKDLGYIRTDGGIRVYYLGVGNDVKETEMTETKPVIEEVSETETVIEPVEEIVDETEISENEEDMEEVDETDNKTDIVMDKSKSNIERIFETLTDFYKTPEKLKYFYDKNQDWVDVINNADYKELPVSTYVSQIKLAINTEFGYPEVAAIPKKKEVKSEEFDGCFM